MVYISNDIRFYGESDLQATFWMKATHLQSGVTVRSDNPAGDMDRGVLLKKLARALAISEGPKVGT